MKRSCTISTNYFWNSETMPYVRLQRHKFIKFRNFNVVERSAITRHLNSETTRRLRLDNLHIIHTAA
jgi:hypothetical protein